jgi:hypothetical protein
MNSAIKNKNGFALVEVLVAAGLMALVSVGMMQLNVNQLSSQKGIDARADANFLRNEVASRLSRSEGCIPTLTAAPSLITPANITTLSTAGGTITVPAILNSDSTPAFVPGQKYGNLRILAPITIENYNPSNNTADLKLLTEYINISTKTPLKVPPIVISLNFQVTSTPELLNCSVHASSAGGAQSEFWSLMSPPNVGLTYTGGSILVGTGTVNNSITTSPSMGVGTMNDVSSYNSFSSGYNNNVDADSHNSVALGGNNTITNSTFSMAFGLSNNINISTGNFGMSGPLASFTLGRVNTVTGSEAGTIGYMNNVSNRFSVAVGAHNNITSEGSYMLGSWSLVSGHNSIGIGQYVESNGNYSSTFGHFLKGNAAGSMTLGDRGSAGVYHINNTPNSLGARFTGGYDFFTSPDPSVDPSGFHINENGSISSGSGNASGIGAIALGDNTLASGNGSVAIGFGGPNRGPLSSGPGAFVLGLGSSNPAHPRPQATNWGAMAFGVEVQAHGNASIAMGKWAHTGVNAIDSVAIGRSSEANEEFTFAAGVDADATAPYASAYGHGGHANHAYSMVIGGYFSGDVLGSTSIRSSADRRLTIGFDNGIEMCTSKTATYLCDPTNTVLYNGGGGFLFPSDKNLKEDFQPIDENKILQKIEELVITSWTYKEQDKKDKNFRNIGPMAQDFHRIFAKPFKLRSTDKLINSNEVMMVSLVGVKALIKKTTDLEKENSELKKQILDIEERLKKIETK